MSYSKTRPSDETIATRLAAYIFREGWSMHGNEISPKACAWLEAHYGITERSHRQRIHKMVVDKILGKGRGSR
jgi:phosphoserine aminotransferase